LERLSDEQLPVTRELIDAIIETLCSTRDPDVSHKAGALLDRLVKKDPTAVATPLKEAASKIINEEIQRSDAEYLLYREAIVVNEHSPRGDVLSAFGSEYDRVISESTKEINITGPPVTRAQSDSLLQVSETSLQSVAAFAAGVAGDGAYLTVLKEYAEGTAPPTQQPQVTAQFLVRTDDSDREEALELLANHFDHHTKRDIVDELIACSPSGDGIRARLAALQRLLPEVSDETVTTAGVEIVINDLTAEAPETRQVAVNTIARVGISETISPDQAIEYLLPRLTDEQSMVAQAVHDQMVRLCNRGEITPQRLVHKLNERAQDAANPEYSCTTIATVGTRYLRARANAVDRLIGLAEGEADIQLAALRGLQKVAESDPTAVRPVASRVEGLTTNTQSDASQCAKQVLKALDRESTGSVSAE
jgi:hypothetical protein